MNLIDVMKQALEALDYYACDSTREGDRARDAITNLRAAIEAVEKVEPVALDYWHQKDCEHLEHQHQEKIIDQLRAENVILKTDLEILRAKNTELERQLERLYRVGHCGSVDSFLACDNEVKRGYFAMMVEESTENKKLRAENAELRKQRTELIEHLEWIGWGDSYERECSADLRKRVKEGT